MITRAAYEDMEEILKLQKLAYRSEAELIGDFTIPPLKQTIEGIRQDFKEQVILKETAGGNITGSVRAYEKDGICYIGRLVVHPEHQNMGIGKELMKSIERMFAGCRAFSLFTRKKSERNLYFYRSLGYRAIREEKISDKLAFVYLEKINEDITA